MNNLLNKTSRVLAWTMAVATSVWLAAPATAVSAAPVYNYKWIDQTPNTITADGKAHYVTALQNQSVTLSMTLQNLSGTTIKGKTSLGAAPAGKQVPIGTFGIGTSKPQDNTPSWLDPSSFVLNNNRFVYYDGADVPNNGQLTLTWTIKIASSAANGTYDLYVKPVFEYQAWTRQVAWNGKLLPTNSSDIFTRVYVGTTPTVNGSVNVSIAGTTPPQTIIAAGAANVTMAKFNFAAGAADNALINTIVLTRTGLSVDADVTGVKLYDGSTQLGSEQSFNTTTHRASFTGLAWLIPAGTSKELSIHVSTAATHVGAVIQIAISSAADITLTGTGTIGGTFPAIGNGFVLANVTVGEFDVNVQTTPAVGNVLSGSTDQAIASFKFAAITEGFNVNSITFTETGTSVDSDVSNLRLKINGAQIGSTMPALTNGTVTFTGNPLFAVPVSQNKIVYIDADIAAGVTSTRTVIFQVYQAADVQAFGQNSSGQVVITRAGNLVFTSQTGLAQSIVQGTLGVTRAATNLSAQAYVVGVYQAEVAKWKFSAGANEGVKVTKLTYTNGGTAPTATDIQNARLYINGAAVPTNDSATVAATTLKFQNGSGLFTVPVSGNTEVTLKVDISSSATVTDTLKYYLSAVTDLEIYGTSSNAKIDSTAANITPITDVAVGLASDHTLAAHGTLIVSAGPNTPAAANFSLGTTNFEFAQFRMQAIGEAAQITATTVRFFDDTAVAGSDIVNLVGTGDVINAKLLWWDGTTWTQLGSTVTTPASGIASFSYSHTVPINTVETFKIVADIPTGATLINLFTGIAGTGDGLHGWDDITVAGVSSGVSYTTAAFMTDTPCSDSALFTKVTPTITALMSTIPTTRTLVANTTNAVLGRLLLTATGGEAINISTLRISADDTAIATDGGPSAASTTFANIRLGSDTNGDGTYELTTITKPFTDGGGAIDYVSYSGSDFNAPANWKISSGGTLVIDILGDVTVYTADSWSFGMVRASGQTSIVGAGALSGTTATIAGLTNAITSAVVTLATGGTLTLTVDTAKPVVQQVMASNTAATVTAPMSRFKLAAANEDILVTMIRVTDAADGNDVDFASNGIALYEGGTIVKSAGGTQSLSGGTLLGTGTLTGTGAESVDITLSPTVTIPASGSKYITIIATMNSIAGGAVSKHVPKLGIEYGVVTGNWTGTSPDYTSNYDVKATGVSSHAGIAVGLGAIGADLLGDAAYIVNTKLGLALSSSTESGSNIVRRASDNFFTVNATNTSANDAALIRAAQVNTADAAATAWTGASTAAGTWAVVTPGDDGSLLTDDAANYVDGTKSQLMTQGVTSPVVGNGMTQTFASRDLSGYAGMGFWIRASRIAGPITQDVTLTGASGGTVTYSFTPGTLAQWQFVNIPFSTTYWTTRTAVTAFKIVNATTAYTAGDTLNIDGLVFYKDYVSLNVVSNAGLIANTTASLLASRITLTDGLLNVLAYACPTGTAAAAVSTSYGTAYFFPLTDISIPAAGKTFQFWADTSVLITGTKTLTNQLALGSTDASGTLVTNSSVWWNDNSSTTYIFWVDSPGGTLQSSISYL